ncbi:glycosyltransferase [Pontibacter pamirensis]|uniref:glycosyltransferase n=1 Tax=Pontibacter pamirensis TaxID=2562824 RepID=UPI0013899901|nr:glycosyltransferase [Pontibacter pamirensis]
MKILQLVTKRQYRGAEVFAANLSKELIRNNVEVVFAGLYNAPENPLEVSGAKNVDLNGKKVLFSLQTLKRLKELVKREKPAVVQANGSDTLKYAVALRVYFPGLPIVYRNISIVSTWFGNSQLKLMLYKKLFTQVQHVSSVGEEAKNDFVHTLAYPAKQASVTRRGIPMEQVDKQEAKQALCAMFNLPLESHIIMHVGNFSPEKNHRFLLEVLKMLKRQDPKIKLVMVGEGVLAETIQKEAVQAGLDDTVYFAGFRSQVQQMLAAADLFVLSSTVEGVPGVILEAGAQKVPAVAVNVGGVGEVVVDGETGVLVPEHDVQLFAEKISSLLNDQAERERLGNGAYRLVTSEYNPDKNAKSFIDLYHSLSK